MTLHQCRVCGIKCSSISHLRRHETIHTTRQLFPCHFCKRQFVRNRDVARRHAISCVQRGDQPLPDFLLPTKPGRRHGACEACIAAKARCDQKSSCARCRRKGVLCLYHEQPENRLPTTIHVQEVQGATESPHSMRPSGIKSHSPAISQNEQRSGIQAGKIPVPWLLNYTDPKSKSISEFYPHHQSSNHHHMEGSDQTIEVSHFASLEEVYAESWDMLWGPQLFSTSGPSLWLPALDDGFIIDFNDTEIETVKERLHQIVVDLHSIHDLLSKAGLRDIKAFSVDAATSYFTLENLQLSIQAYFKHWSPNCPIIHRPFFDPTIVHLPLLATIFLIGGAYTTDSPDLGQEYLELVEEYAFEHESFKRIFRRDDVHSSCDVMQDLEPLQAAYLIVLPLMWGRDMAARRRVRNHRFHEVVAAARQLGLFRACTEIAAGTTDAFENFDWYRFSVQESKIRLGHLIFGIDTNFAIFHGTHQRMSITELTGDFSCSEACFSANTSIEFERCATAVERKGRGSLAARVALLLQDTWDASCITKFEGLTVMNLFFVMIGLYSVILSTQAQGLGRYSSGRFFVALERWKRVWDVGLEKVPSKEFELIGFMKGAAPEFWRLALIINETNGDGERFRGSIENVDREQLEKISLLLRT